jgi:hypothetical protein
VGCGGVVLELEGQFEKLDSYYLEPGGPSPESAGYWHVRCLGESPHAGAWYVARRQNFVDVRGYREVANTTDWSVIQDPRRGEVLALARTGEMIALTFSPGKFRRYDDGSVYRVEATYELVLDERLLIGRIQRELEATTEVPLRELLTMLGVVEQVAHPRILDGSTCTVQRGLRRRWEPTRVAMQISHGVFVPTELVPHVRRTAR